MSDLCDLTQTIAEPMLLRILDIWQDLLRVPQIGPDDDFFDLGGDSLLAIQLFAEIERLIGRQLPIITIYDAPTPASLLALLGDLEHRPAFSPLVPMGDHDPDMEPDGRPAMFIVHGIGGHVMELNRLGRIMETDCRVYGLQARGLDGIESPLDRIEDMAASYLAAMQDVQPHGPYVLVGYSFGGLVALEMAQRIEAAGEQVALLAFIDSYPHPDDWPRGVWLDVRLRRMTHRARTLLGHWLGNIGLRRRNPARESAGPVLPRSSKPPPMRTFPADAMWPDAVQRTYDAALLALSRYRLQPYGGPVVFFRAARRSFYLPSQPHSVWRGLLPGLEVVTVPGDHVEMIGRGARVLARQLVTRMTDGLNGLPP